jgi:hypothetical protein
VVGCRNADLVRPFPVGVDARNSGIPRTGAAGSPIPTPKVLHGPHAAANRQTADIEAVCGYLITKPAGAPAEIVRRLLVDANCLP